MKTQKALCLFVAATLGLSGLASASPSKTYEVTGPILEMNDSMITVQKGKEKWEIARDSSTKATGEMKVGDKVTITYTMAATKVEVKAAKGDKASKAEGAHAEASVAPEKK